MSASASHVSSQSRTRVKLNSIFPAPLLVSPKFPHVPLGVGGWPLGKGVGLIVHAISFEVCQPT